jgi:hypothetical protein
MLIDRAINEHAAVGFYNVADTFKARCSVNEEIYECFLLVFTTW